ncbi:Na(+)/H(+) antiporter subunit C [Cumulibacter soli]|uniref:Na(+)/H(+) antiporter subunit C n=1 Tax=Cumulibacter soli TaxID=2546344 RepID=UPI001FB9EFDA|nr:Na(+)/H(+) antiporter subunit C [Cumulibacter soli]
MTPIAADAHLQPNITLILVGSVLVAAGVYLLLERSLTRVLLGIVLMSNGVAGLYLVVMGKARGAPLLGERPPEEMSDPLPEALVLTAIVISLATVAFMMALAYRYWRLTGSDDVPDDLEDALILRLAERDQPSESYDADVTSTTEAEEDPEEAEAREAEERARTEAAALNAAVEADVGGEYPKDAEGDDSPGDRDDAGPGAEPGTDGASR